MLMRCKYVWMLVRCMCVCVSTYIKEKYISGPIADCILKCELLIKWISGKSASSSFYFSLLSLSLSSPSLSILPSSPSKMT